MPNDASIPGWAAGLLISALMLSIFVGSRLLSVARRTRRWPEFAIGFFVVADALGNIGTVLVVRHSESLLLPAAPQLLTVLGAVAFYTATWRVFRPGSTWGAIAAMLGALALLSGWAGRVWIDGHPFPVTFPSPSNLLLLFARIGAFAWWAIEAFVYSRKVTRQERLDLAPPGTARRFLLWSVVGAASLTCLGCLLVLTLVGATLADVPPLYIVLALAVVIANAAAYVSFFWPSLLTRRAATRQSVS